ncbi:hypothetical protein [Robiginitalea aurantiaca]|uniref:Zf-HC2 domain-containing protein n=1 Tax=Robiginitalea aurantiaca TaxID=3056915 RepID=A0ABT7WHB6_9FLAO|nr:hypothetical protein [Robiginitalea aurantiaca]MDM9632305.1 hypothetical protein [Robiginitalea aurantiaca]
MISCEKAALICSKTQYREAGLWEQFQLRMHLFICKTCTEFSRRNAKLTELCSKASVKTLTREEKYDLKIRLKKEGDTKS